MEIHHKVCLFCNRGFTYDYGGKGAHRKYCSHSCLLAATYDRNKLREGWLEGKRRLEHIARRKKGKPEVGTRLTIICKDHGEPHTYTYRGGRFKKHCKPTKKELLDAPMERLHAP